MTTNNRRPIDWHFCGLILIGLICLILAFLLYFALGLFSG